MRSIFPPAGAVPPAGSPARSANSGARQVEFTGVGIQPNGKDGLRLLANRGAQKQFRTTKQENNTCMR